MRTELKKSNNQGLHWLWLFINHYYIAVAYWCVVDDFGNTHHVDLQQTAYSLLEGEDYYHA